MVAADANGNSVEFILKSVLAENADSIQSMRQYLGGIQMHYNYNVGKILYTKGHLPHYTNIYCR